MNKATKSITAAVALTLTGCGSEWCHIDMSSGKAVLTCPDGSGVDISSPNGEILKTLECTGDDIYSYLISDTLEATALDKGMIVVEFADSWYIHCRQISYFYNNTSWSEDTYSTDNTYWYPSDSQDALNGSIGCGTEDYARSFDVRSQTYDYTRLDGDASGTVPCVQTYP